jgi:hypothetical protein
MEELIELYLFKNRKCPLPELGTLVIIETNAVASLAERKIHAPVSYIQFIESTMQPDDFIDFIAINKNISIEEAAALLKQYCSSLQNMDAYGETRLQDAGKFYVNADGMLIFKAIEIPKIFFPDVNAERVIHPDASHNMRVGDKETTSAEMTAYYTDAGSTNKNKWWITAIVLIIIAAVALIMYFNDNGNTSTFGNQQPIIPKASTTTYQQAK